MKLILMKTIIVLMMWAPNWTLAQQTEDGSTCKRVKSDSEEKAGKACGEAVECINKTTAVLCNKTRKAFKETTQKLVDSKADNYRNEGRISQLARQIAASNKAAKEKDKEHRKTKVKLDKTEEELADERNRVPWWAWVAIGAGTAALGAGAIKVFFDI